MPAVPSNAGFPDAPARFVLGRPFVNPGRVRAPCHWWCVTVAFAKTSPALAFDKALGLCFGWLCFSKKDGQPYVDLHGDHFPDDELLKAADEWMAKPASERLLNVEHAGGGRGEIRTVYALTEDVAKAHGIDTGGTYGLVGSLRPDAALMKSITDGALVCLSIEGSAADVEQVAKAAGDIEATAHKRTMRKVSLSKLALVKNGAHEGASVALIKSARAALAIAKATPALTSADAGHQHLIHDIDEASGCTSGEAMASGLPDNGWHSHVFVRNPDGTISIAMALGHTHTLATDTTESTMADTDLAKTAADLAKAQTRAATVLALPVEQFTFAKGLSGDRLEAFLSATPTERTAQSTPVYKAADGTCYFAGDDQRLVTMAKSADASAVELAKAKDAAEAVTFEKAATATIPHLKGTLPQKAAIMKSIAGLPDADRTAVLEILKGADAAMKMLSTPVGFAGSGDPIVKSAQDELDALAADIRKAQGVSIAKALDLALSTPRGAQLYDAIEAAKRPTARA